MMWWSLFLLLLAGGALGVAVNTQEIGGGEGEEEKKNRTQASDWPGYYWKDEPEPPGPKRHPCWRHKCPRFSHCRPDAYEEYFKYKCECQYGYKASHGRCIHRRDLPHPFKEDSYTDYGKPGYGNRLPPHGHGGRLGFDKGDIGDLFHGDDEHDEDGGLELEEDYFPDDIDLLDKTGINKAAPHPGGFPHAGPGFGVGKVGFPHAGPARFGGVGKGFPHGGPRPGRFGHGGGGINPVIKAPHHIHSQAHIPLPYARPGVRGQLLRPGPGYPPDQGYGPSVGPHRPRGPHPAGNFHGGFRGVGPHSAGYGPGGRAIHFAGAPNLPHAGLGGSHLSRPHSPVVPHPHPNLGPGVHGAGYGPGIRAPHAVAGGGYARPPFQGPNIHGPHPGPVGRIGGGYGVGPGVPHARIAAVPHAGGYGPRPHAAGARVPHGGLNIPLAGGVGVGGYGNGVPHGNVRATPHAGIGPGGYAPLGTSVPKAPGVGGYGPHAGGAPHAGIGYSSPHLQGTGVPNSGIGGYGLHAGGAPHAVPHAPFNHYSNRLATVPSYFNQPHAQTGGYGGHGVGGYDSTGTATGVKPLANSYAHNAAAISPTPVAGIGPSYGTGSGYPATGLSFGLGSYSGTSIPHTGTGIGTGHFTATGVLGHGHVPTTSYGAGSLFAPTSIGHSLGSSSGSYLLTPSATYGTSPTGYGLGTGSVGYGLGTGTGYGTGSTSVFGSTSIHSGLPHSTGSGHSIFPHLGGYGTKTTRKASDDDICLISYPDQEHRHADDFEFKPFVGTDPVFPIDRSRVRDGPVVADATDVTAGTRNIAREQERCQHILRTSALATIATYYEDPDSNAASVAGVCSISGLLGGLNPDGASTVENSLHFPANTNTETWVKGSCKNACCNRNNLAVPMAEADLNADQLAVGARTLEMTQFNNAEALETIMETSPEGCCVACHSNSQCRGTTFDGSRSVESQTVCQLWSFTIKETDVVNMNKLEEVNRRIIIQEPLRNLRSGKSNSGSCPFFSAVCADPFENCLDRPGFTPPTVPT